MKKRSAVSIGIGVCVFLILMTSIFPSEIMGWGGGKPRTTPRAVMTILDKNQPLPKLNAIYNRPPLASSQLVSRSVEVAGNEVRVAVTADLQVDLTVAENDPVHLWRLRAFREDGSLELDRPYVDQQFQIHRSGSMSPTFMEVFQLPPGKHRVLVSLYGVPPNYDLNNLNDEAKAQAAGLIQVNEVIEVQ